MRKTLLAGAAGVLVLLGVRPAAANGRFPQSNQILFSTSDPNLIVARTTYAILISHDNGPSWSFLCEDVLGIGNAVQDPEIALTGNNTLIAGSPTGANQGLNVSTDLGCNWHCVGGPLAGQSIADVVVRPDAPHTVLALTGTPKSSDGGVNNFSQVFQSTDDGTTWSALGMPIDSTWTVETIDVTKTDPNRIYVSAWKGYNAGRVAALFVSKDEGMTWTEHDVTGFDGTTEDRLWIGGVDPTQADRVYLRSNAHLDGGRSRLYLTTDAGQTFTELKSFDVEAAKPSYQVGEFLGFTLSPDGSKIYIGDYQGGMFVAERSSMPVFSETSPIDIHCLAMRPLAGGGSETWACADAYTSVKQGMQFVLGSTTDDGRTFTPRLGDNSALVGPVACAANPGGPLGCGASFNGSGCAAAYALWCGQQFPNCCGGDAGGGDPASCAGDGGGGASSGTGATSGAGASGSASGGTGSGSSADGSAPSGDGGAAGATSGSSTSSSSCGCSMVGGGGAAGLLAACAAAAVALGRRRRRS